jgi:chromodomain-helicase-DNA-binding protein 4
VSSQTVEDEFEDALAVASPIKKAHPNKRNRAGSESDTDFQAGSEDDSEPEPDSLERSCYRDELYT